MKNLLILLALFLNFGLIAQGILDEEPCPDWDPHDPEPWCCNLASTATIVISSVSNTLHYPSKAVD